MTNYDRIRSMSLDEMANFLSLSVLCLDDKLGISPSHCDDGCLSCYKKWLTGETRKEREKQDDL